RAAAAGLARRPVAAQEDLRAGVGARGRRRGGVMGQNGTALVITGIGMRTAVGQNAVQTCAAGRAGMNRFVEWASFADAPGLEEAAATAAPVRPDLGNVPWMEKFEALAAQPLLEALWMAKLNRPLAANAQRTALYLATPSDRPGVGAEALAAFRTELEQ